MTTQDNELLELVESINNVRTYIRDLEVQDCFEEFNWTNIDKALRTVKEDLIESRFWDEHNKATIKKEGGDNDERS